MHWNTFCTKANLYGSSQQRVNFHYYKIYVHKEKKKEEKRMKKDKVIIGLIAVFDAILTGKQGGQKYGYGNPIANNFFQNWIFHYLRIQTLKYLVEDYIHQVWRM